MALVSGRDHGRWTAAALRAMPDDGMRYEIVDGELLVTPAPAWGHQHLTRHLLRLLGDYLAAHRLGEVICAPADVPLSDDTVVEPDLFVVPLVNDRAPQSWSEVRQLLLVVEILSPGTARVDRTTKRRMYQREGIPEYWIVDGEARAVERWRPEDERPEVIPGTLAWKPDDRVSALALDLPKLFAVAFGE